MFYSKRTDHRGRGVQDYKAMYACGTCGSEKNRKASGKVEKVKPKKTILTKDRDEQLKNLTYNGKTEVLQATGQFVPC